jgi:hypothetical protein
MRQGLREVTVAQCAAAGHAASWPGDRVDSVVDERPRAAGIPPAPRGPASARRPGERILPFERTRRPFVRQFALAIATDYH